VEDLSSEYGGGTAYEFDGSVFTEVEGRLQVVDTDSGYCHRVVLTDEGKVVTWPKSKEDYGQCGTTIPRGPLPALDGLAVRMVCAGYYYSIAVV